MVLTSYLCVPNSEIEFIASYEESMELAYKLSSEHLLNPVLLQKSWNMSFLYLYLSNVRNIGTISIYYLVYFIIDDKLSLCFEIPSSCFVSEGGKSEDSHNFCLLYDLFYKYKLIFFMRFVLILICLFLEKIYNSHVTLFSTYYGLLSEIPRNA